MLSPVEAHGQSDGAARASLDWTSPWSVGAKRTEAEPAGRGRSDRSEGRHHAGCLPAWSETGWNQHCVHTVRLRDAPNQARTHGRTRKGRCPGAGRGSRAAPYLAHHECRAPLHFQAARAACSHRTRETRMGLGAARLETGTTIDYNPTPPPSLRRCPTNKRMLSSRKERWWRFGLPTRRRFPPNTS